MKIYLFLCLSLYINICLTFDKQSNIYNDSAHESIKLYDQIHNSSSDMGLFAIRKADNGSEKTDFLNIVNASIDNFEPALDATGFEIPYSTKMTARHFYLFTKDYRKGLKYELLDPTNITSIKSSHFETRKTYIIIHGFIGYGLESWILSIKDALLEREDANVISVDWPAGTRWFLPTYYEAAGRVSQVGNNTALLIYNLLQFKGLVLENVHCIGHSLGAHVCGFAGKPFQGRIGRISGLDPAGPRFQKLNSSSRLDRKDAVYVDVMHTNACDFDYWLDCYGLDEAIGHSDFYPNGGEHQPGCPSKYVQTVGGDIGCSHQMAYRYYIESLDYSLDSTYFLARPCSSWDSYHDNNCSCGKTAQFMGINVNTELDGLFFVETNTDPPYAETDPDCSDRRNWNFLIIIGYVLIALAGIAFVVTFLVITLKNITKCFCAPEIDAEDTGNLINEEEDKVSEESGVEDVSESESDKVPSST